MSCRLRNAFIVKSFMTGATLFFPGTQHTSHQCEFLIWITYHLCTFFSWNNNQSMKVLLGEAFFLHISFHHLGFTYLLEIQNKLLLWYIHLSISVVIEWIVDIIIYNLLWNPFSYCTKIIEIKVQDLSSKRSI